jgi:hypothetical protein
MSESSLRRSVLVSSVSIFCACSASFELARDGT